MIPNFTRFTTRQCGEVITFHYESPYCVHIIFVDTGYATTTRRSTLLRTGPLVLRDPNIPHLWCLESCGVPADSKRVQGCDLRTYGVWYAMLRRCYVTPQQPCYEGVTVCREWHDFQTFAQWYSANGGGKCLELDKDIKVKGNKVYSPEGCMIVTREENMRATRPHCDFAKLREDIRGRQARATPRPPRPAEGYDYQAQRERHHHR